MCVILKRYQFIEIFRCILCFYFIKSIKTSKPPAKTLVTQFCSENSFDCVCDNCKGSITLNLFDVVRITLIAWLIIYDITVI